jgi:predicted nucleotidyltransferase
MAGGTSKETKRHSRIERDLAEARSIVQRALKGYQVRIYLFGSQIREGKRLSASSDIDIAILPLEPLPAGTLSRLREALEESNVLRQVDLVDLSRTDPELRELVLKEGVLWNDFGNE